MYDMDAKTDVRFMVWVDIVHTYTYSGAGFLQRCVPARAIEHQQWAPGSLYNR